MIPSSFRCSKGPCKVKKKKKNSLSKVKHESSQPTWRPSSDTSCGGTSYCEYLAVGAVDERSFSQQVSEEGWQFSGQRHHLQDLRHAARHVHHGLVGEAHIQSSVASFQPVATGI